MIRNYITIAFRSMMRNKTFSVINILGLSVSIACCLLLALYIQDEIRYDKHHHDLDDLYQVTSIMGESGSHVMRSTSAPIVWGIKDELPEIEKVTRLVNPPGVSQNLLRYGDKQFYESDGFIADSTLFDIFTYQFKSGNPKKALVEANSIVITERLAEKLFGNEPALNKVISVNQGGPTADFKVTGVLKMKQGNSHLKASFFVSMTSSGWAEYLRSPQITDQWAGQNFLLSYIKLKPGSSPDDFIPKMNNVFLKYGAEDLKTLGMTKTLGLQPVKDIYLYATYGNKNNARILYLYVIGSIAGFILLIACINFMNLSTAKAAKRANEVGLRKTLGAQRASLVTQFMGEALIIVVLAVLMSLILVQLLLPVFNQLTQKNIGYETENLLFFFSVLLVIAMVTGLLAGSYPALYLSSFQPAKVLKGKLSLNNSGSMLRKSLVVFQFVVAITLVCGMFVITRQLKFMQETDLGFSTRNKIVLPLRTQQARDNHTVLRNELTTLASVKDLSGVHYVPGVDILNDFSLFPEGSSIEKAVLIKNSWIEPNYLKIMDIKLLAGRHFSYNRKLENQNKIIVNRTAAKMLGFEPEQIIGQPLYSAWTGEDIPFEVIGVMEDYHQVSLKQNIYPVLFRIPENESTHNFMVLDVAEGNISETLSQIEKSWKRLNPETPFEYTFLDENVKRQYEDDKRVSKVISSFTVIAMIISCLGLYGLSSYMTERRFKEIGIRKVMGATLSQIARMMSGEFVRLVIIAFLISVPLSWYIITTWLESFAYKTPVSSMIFIGAGLSALAIALITVSFESIKAASANPVRALRNE